MNCFMRIKLKEVNITEYKQILTILKRYSFEEKMRICQDYSRKTITPRGIMSIDKLLSSPLPWNLETFLLLSIKSKEWRSNNFQKENSFDFKKIINCIKNFNPLDNWNRVENNKFGEFFMISAGNLQFDIQEQNIYKLYRYYKYFNFKNDKINMPYEFKNKFGCEYDEFAKLGFLMWQDLCSDSVIPKEIDISDFLSYILVKYPTAMQNLIITRDEYIKQLDSITKNSSDYIYCFRPSYVLPFIRENGKTYLPLPHLLIRSVTSSLLYRLTDNNKPLLDIIGKEVFEKYLYDIIKESHVFDEVYGEQKYITKTGDENKTLDIMTKIGDDYLFFESKSTSPKINVRIIDTDCIEKNEKILAGSCAQVYRHLILKFQNDYNPFSIKASIDKENIWGIVVVREESYVLRENIYKKVAEILQISINSNEYNWMCRHIRITQLYEIERYCFVGDSIMENIKHNSVNGRINDYWFSNETINKNISNENLNLFMNNLYGFIIDFIKEMIENNVYK